MAQVQIDCYGNLGLTGSSRFCHKLGEKFPVLVDNYDDDTTYICFDRETAGAQPIQQVKKSGTVTQIMWAYGEWSNRTNLTYDKTMNEPLTITI